MELGLTAAWQNLQTPDELEEEDRAAQAAVRRPVELGAATRS